ncbi:MAG: leucine-rich repeat domain-containing protein [Lachnospiraceae bacterium]|nr:leucine-rich repeat domain-containing protein [Lachnospiraceae bacterium]
MLENLAFADEKSGGKYRITKLNKKSGKIKGGNVEYVAPYDKNTTKINTLASIKIAGVTFKVTSIGKNCGKGCQMLKTVVVGKNVTKIGKNAFKGCAKLKKIQIKGKKLKKVGGGAFKGIAKKAVIKVPSAKLSKYKKLLKGKGQGKGVKIKK